MLRQAHFPISSLLLSQATLIVAFATISTISLIVAHRPILIVAKVAHAVMALELAENECYVILSLSVEPFTVY